MAGLSCPSARRLLLLAAAERQGEPLLVWQAANKAEGPAIMLSEDLQEGLKSLASDGLGHATFNNR